MAAPDKAQGKKKQSSKAAEGLDPALLQLLVCPMSKHRLDYNPRKSELISKSARLAYPIRGGIPILLPSEARPLKDSELR